MKTYIVIICVLVLITCHSHSPSTLDMYEATR